MIVQVGDRFGAPALISAFHPLPRFTRVTLTGIGNRCQWLSGAQGFLK